MRVKYHPAKWRPDPLLEKEVLHLFTLLHIVEPIDKLTLHLVDNDSLLIDILNFESKPVTAYACYCDSNDIYLPAKRTRGFIVPKKSYNAFVLWNLVHEYVHAIRTREGRDHNHRGHPQEMIGLHNRLTRET